MKKPHSFPDSKLNPFEEFGQEACAEGYAQLTAMLDDGWYRADAAPRRHRQRKPSVATMIKQAEKSGKAVSSITTPDGTTIHFGEPAPTEASNPWLADLNKVTKQ